MTPVRWNQCLVALALVRIGQELGHDSQLARAVHDLIDAVFTIIR